MGKTQTGWRERLEPNVVAVGRMSWAGIAHVFTRRTLLYTVYHRFGGRRFVCFGFDPASAMVQKLNTRNVYLRTDDKRCTYTDFIPVFQTSFRCQGQIYLVMQQLDFQPYQLFFSNTDFFHIGSHNGIILYQGHHESKVCAFYVFDALRNEALDLREPGWLQLSQWSNLRRGKAPE